MKKVFFALAAVVALAACSKEQIIEVPQPEAIDFGTPFVDNSTRATDPSYSGTTDFGSFNVWGTVDGGAGLVPIFAGETVTGTVGVGNVVGVTTAIVAGGPGAIFWMWLAAFFGMMTKYCEVVLSINYRERDEKGDWVGGPMYYIEKGMGKNWKWLAVLFAFFGILASFGRGFQR